MGVGVVGGGVGVGEEVAPPRVRVMGVGGLWGVTQGQATVAAAVVFVAAAAAAAAAAANTPRSTTVAETQPVATHKHAPPCAQHTRTQMCVRLVHNNHSTVTQKKITLIQVQAVLIIPMTGAPQHSCGEHFSSGKVRSGVRHHNTMASQLDHMST